MSNEGPTGQTGLTGTLVLKQEGPIGMPIEEDGKNIPEIVISDESISKSIVEPVSNEKIKQSESIPEPVSSNESKQNSTTNLSKNQKKKLKNQNSNTGHVRICLNMIVRDESKNMIACMNSVKHIIDAVAIVDTGSEDNTIEVINNYCKEHNIPGEVISKKWVDDFGHSRTEALRHAEDFTKRLDNSRNWYVVFLDADNRAKGNSGDQFPLDKSKLVDDNYSATHQRGATMYPYPWIVRLHPKGQPEDPAGPKS